MPQTGQTHWSDWLPGSITMVAGIAIRPDGSRLCRSASLGAFGAE
jgi:hypothetical protein